MDKVARALSVFVTWCALNNVAWQTADYDTVLDFQKDQHSGRWSPSGEALDAATANFRADVATNFLNWAGSRRLRGTFQARYVTRSVRLASSHSSRTSYREVQIRWGRAKGSRSRGDELVFLPAAADVRAWLALLELRRGHAKYLAARFIFETGARRAETTAISETQIPSAVSLDAFERSGMSRATMTLTECTKGGRPRNIEVALPFLRMLRTWIDGPRMRLRFLWHRRTGKQPSRLLFLSDAKGHEGTPIADYTIYDCFHELKPASPKWHPHYGRHAYACYYVLHALDRETTAAGRTLSEMGVDWINARGQFWLRTLQHQLGHLSEQTTDTYLRWLVTTCGLADFANAWHEFLSADDPESPNE